MTDPMTIAIATAMAGKAVEVAGEPARAAAAELAQRIRERFRGRPAEAEVEVLAGAADDPERIRELADAVRRLLNEDPKWAAQLEATWSQAQTAATANGDGVVNVHNGAAEKVVQLRDVQGDLNIG